MEPGKRKGILLSNRHPISFLKSKLSLIIRLFIGIILIYPGIQKVIDPFSLAKIIYAYDLFPHITINMIAIILPFLEIVTGVAFITGRYIGGASVISMILFSAFVIAISINLFRGHEFDCGCFSVSGGSHTSPVELLIRDIFYLACVIYLAVKEVSSKQTR